MKTKVALSENEKVFGEENGVGDEGRSRKVECPEALRPEPRAETMAD